MNVRVDISEALAGIEAMQEFLENPAPIARAWAKGYKASVKATLAQGGKGSIPYAESTRKRMEATGTSQITKRGTVRSDRIKRTANQIKRHAKKLQDDGWSPDWQKKQDALQNRLANYQKAEARAQKKDASKRKIGKRQSERNQHPLQNMSKTIVSKITGEGDGLNISVFSRVDEVGAIHDEGGPAGKGAQEPKREFIVTPDFDQQIERLGEMIASGAVEAFDNG